MITEPVPMGGISFDQAIWLHAIAALPPTLVALAALVKVVKGRKETKADIRDVHISINSRMTQLLQEAKEGSYAAGQKAEQDLHKGS